MEDVLDDGTQYDSLQVTAEARMYLLTTAKWSKVLAIIGFVITALIVVVGITIASYMGSLFPEMSDEALDSWGGARMTGFISIFYIVLGLVFLPPCYYLLKFANQTRSALSSNDSTTLTEALKNHKSVYKFWGILMIVMLGFYALIFVIGIIGGVASSF